MSTENTRVDGMMQASCICYYSKGSDSTHTKDASDKGIHSLQEPGTHGVIGIDDDPVLLLGKRSECE